MKKTKFIATAMVGIMLIGATTSVSAKTLKESFSGGSDIAATDYSLIRGTSWTKTAWAKTSGYYNSKQRHYVRAYIGSMDRGNLWADSGRKYAYGDVYTSCNATVCDGNQNTPAKLLFPTAYSKYGME